MSNRIGYMFQNKQLTIVLDGTPYDVPSTHPQYKEITPLIASPKDETEEMEEARVEQLHELLSREPKRIAEMQEQLAVAIGFDDVKIEQGVVLIKGEAIHSSLTDRIIELQSVGLPFTPFVNFLVNLENNPSEESRNTLFDFLERGRFPLTDDGCFLGYKGVTSKDIGGEEVMVDNHTRSFDMSPGKIHRMPWENVDNNSNNGCGAGFHVGTIRHAQGYGEYMILVKVNPRDCVSVPKYETEKLRCCAYEVVNVYKEKRGAQELVLPAYSSDQYYKEDFEVDEEEFREQREQELKEEEEEKQVEDREYYEGFSRDDLCRLASRQGIFASTNEARELGKELVIEALLISDIPFEHMNFAQISDLALRRRLYASKSAAHSAGKAEVVVKLRESNILIRKIVKG